MLKAHWDLMDKFSDVAGATKDPLKVSYAQIRANPHMTNRKLRFSEYTRV